MAEFSEDNLKYRVVISPVDGSGRTEFESKIVDFNKVLSILEDFAEECHGKILTVTPYAMDKIGVTIGARKEYAYEAVITVYVGNENLSAIARVIDLELA